jgi:glycosyltransferase involved in cell wall biosynthesis
MKIVYYLPSLYISGGLERVITEKANYFAGELGYDVTILTSEQRGKKIYYPLSPKVHHYDLNVIFDVENNHSLLLKLIAYPFKYFLFKYRFSNFLNKCRPDITISTLRREINFINSLQDGSTKIGEFHITRNAYHSVSGELNKRCKRINLYLQRHFSKKLRLFSKIVLLTKEEQGKWSELNNTVVIHNPLTLISKETALLENKRVIAVGRYTYQKGFDLLVETWKIVSGKYPDWSLHIYGEGDRTDLDNRIQTLNLSNSCFLEGSTNDIKRKYLESSIFVLSSRYEGFGMVLIEAMACGVPPVSFACPCGPREIIKDGEDGFLVENGNIEMLAEKICYLIENEDVRKRLGKNARQSAERFRIEEIAKQWETLFKELLEKKNFSIQ